MGKSSSTSTTTQNPYAPSAPLYQQSADIVNAYLKNPNSTAVYGGPRTVGMSGMTHDGMNALGNNAGYGQARDYLSRSLNGEYTAAGNPHLERLQGAIRSQVMPSVNATFAKSGMMGSTMHQGTLARGLSEGMANPMFQNYENERNRQQAAAGMLPQLDQANAQAQIAAGQLGEGYDRDVMQANWQKWQEEQDAPLRGLQKTMPFTQAIGGAGGTSSTTQTQRQSPWQTAAGLGMMGASLFGGPMMAGLGGMGSAMSGMAQYGAMPWLNAGGSNFGFRGGYATPAQRA